MIKNLKKDWCNKISNTITNKIINGEINTMSNFKTGWYENKNGKHWFSSGLENDAMVLLDKYKIKWKKQFNKNTIC